MLHDSKGGTYNFHADFIFDFAPSNVTAIEHWADGPHAPITHHFVYADNNQIVLYKDYMGDGYVANGSINRRDGSVREEFKLDDGSSLITTGNCKRADDSSPIF